MRSLVCFLYLVHFEGRRFGCGFGMFVCHFVLYDIAACASVLIYMAIFGFFSLCEAAISSRSAVPVSLCDFIMPPLPRMLRFHMTSRRHHHLLSNARTHPSDPTNPPLPTGPTLQTLPPLPDIHNRTQLTHPPLAIPTRQLLRPIAIHHHHVIATSEWGIAIFTVGLLRVVGGRWGYEVGGAPVRESPVVVQGGLGGGVPRLGRREGRDRGGGGGGGEEFRVGCFFVWVRLCIFGWEGGKCTVNSAFVWSTIPKPFARPTVEMRGWFFEGIDRHAPVIDLV